MLKKRLTIGARARNKKSGDCDGVIKSILGSGKQLLEWSDKETEEEVNSRSMFRFAKVEEEEYSSSDNQKGGASSIEIMHAKANSSTHLALSCSGMK